MDVSSGARGEYILSLCAYKGYCRGARCGRIKELRVIPAAGGNFRWGCGCGGIWVGGVIFCGIWL